MQLALGHLSSGPFLLMGGFSGSRELPCSYLTELQLTGLPGSAGEPTPPRLPTSLLTLPSTSAISQCPLLETVLSETVSAREAVLGQGTVSQVEEGKEAGHPVRERAKHPPLRMNFSLVVSL